MSDDRPWEDFADPLKPAASPAADSDVGYAEDIGKGAVGGFGRGVTGLAGTGGTVRELAEAGYRKLGVPEGVIAGGKQALRYGLPVLGPALAGPSGHDIQKVVEDYTGKFYEPKTIPGQYASTLAEFAPGMVVPGGSLAARAANTVTSALASETAGQLTKGTAAEPYARGIAGVAAAPVAAKAITPAAPASAARQAAVQTLEREGIPVSAGQRTGSKPIQWAESTAMDMPWASGPARAMNARQAAAYDRAVTNRLYDPGQLRARGVPEGVSLPDPRVARAGPESLSGEYERLSRAHQLRADPQLIRDLYAAQTRYERNVLPSQRTRDVERIRDDLADAMIAGQGRMPGGQYQAHRSRLGTLAKGQQNDPYLAGAFRDMRSALDRTMERSLPPREAAAWRLNNRRYANMKQLEPAVAAADENLSPLRVAQTARSRRPGQYAAQRGDLDELARAGAMILKPLPQSGTAPRAAMQQLFSIPQLLTAGGGATAGSALAGGGAIAGPIGAIVGATAPFATSRAVVSPLGQAYLGNRALPQNTRDIIAQSLAQQAGSQPAGIERNEAAQEAYERERQDELRKKGL